MGRVNRNIAFEYAQSVRSYYFIQDMRKVPLGLLLSIETHSTFYSIE